MYIYIHNPERGRDEGTQVECIGLGLTIKVEGKEQRQEVESRTRHMRAVKIKRK